MLSDTSLVIQTLNSNLYYLRTLGDFSFTLQLSFLPGNEEYIEAAQDFALRSEELLRTIMKYANGNVTKEAVNNKIFVTEYTLDCERLTEKLFNVDIDTNITEQQLNLTPGIPTNPSQEMISELDKVNKDALVLATNFIDFCNNISERMKKNELFSYSYITLIEAMLIEMNLYKSNLERLIERNTINPTFIVDYEYLFNYLLQLYSSCITGLVDPSNPSAVIRAFAFSSEFNLLANEYKNAVISPEAQENLEMRTEDTLNRFKGFISAIIQELLDAKTYFIVPPILLDNIYTTANYFTYVLRSSEQKELI